MRPVLVEVLGLIWLLLQSLAPLIHGHLPSSDGAPAGQGVHVHVLDPHPETGTGLAARKPEPPAIGVAEALPWDETLVPAPLSRLGAGLAARPGPAPAAPPWTGARPDAPHHRPWPTAPPLKA